MRYRNENTDDVVEFDEPNPRLDALPNWHRLDDEPASEPEPEAEQTDEAKTKPPRKS